MREILERARVDHVRLTCAGRAAAGAAAAFGLWFLTVLAVSSRGGKYGYVAPAGQRMYKALRRKGFSKSHAAATANNYALHGRVGGRKATKRNLAGRKLKR